MSLPSPPLVVVVDDDAAVRDALDSLLRSVGLQTRVLGAPSELLQAVLPDVPGCIVLDVRLPGISGLDLQGQLAVQGIHLPIVFMTGHGDIPMTVRAMKAGAVDFLAKRSATRTCWMRSAPRSSATPAAARTWPRAVRWKRATPP
jgi:FixJ family two-component response regulator